jgi:4-amino-4-deoxy-L-arabinose transferase-like glycosyltransferase
MGRSMPSLPSTILRRLRAAEWGITVAGLGCVLFFFALLKLYSLNFVKGDEHMYFYMSLLVSKGKWPYRDFFFSHPPLQLYLMGALYKLFGYSLALSKAVPSLAAMVSGVYVYLLGRRLVGRSEALLAVILFLFTFDVLRGSSHFTGASCALAFGLAASYQALARRPIFAGVLFAIGTFIGIYIAPLALMLSVLLAFRSWKESLRLLGSTLVVSALICAVFAGVAGHAFWYQVFGYNLNKVALRYSWFAKARNVAYLNTAVILGFVPGIVWAIAIWVLRGRVRGEAALSGPVGRLGAWLNLWGGDRVAAQMIFATFICGYLYFYSTRVDYYSYYFMLIMPWMGLMTATVTVDVLRYLGERLASVAPGEPPLSRGERRRRQQAARRQERTAGPPPPAPRLAWRLWPLVACAVALALVLLYRQGIGADRQEEAGDGTMTYAWRDSPFLPGVVNGMVRALFWSPASDSTHPPNAITYYLQHETLSAPTIDAFVRAVRSQCRPGERIFGEYSLGPFAAAVGSCVLGANLADTNPHRFKVHESTPEDWVRALEQDHLGIAIVVPGSSILKERAMRDYLTGTFPRLVATWDDPYVGHVELHRRAE